MKITKLSLILLIIGLSACVAEPYQPQSANDGLGYTDNVKGDEFYYIRYIGRGSKSQVKKYWKKRAFELCKEQKYSIVHYQEFRKFLDSETAVTVANGIPLAHGENRYAQVSAGSVLCETSKLTLEEAKSQIKLRDSCLKCAYKRSLDDKVDGSFNPSIQLPTELDANKSE